MKPKGLLDDLFDCFGGASSVARLLGVGASTASEMKRRGSIPVHYWPRLIEGATERGICGVTHEALTTVHAEKRPWSEPKAVA